MSGVGVIPSYGAIAERLASAAPRPAGEDPGALFLPLLQAPELELVGVIGHHMPNGWGVRLQLRAGPFSQRLDLEVGAARARAREILSLCDLIENGFDR